MFGRKKKEKIKEYDPNPKVGIAGTRYLDYITIYAYDNEGHTIDAVQYDAISNTPLTLDDVYGIDELKDVFKKYPNHSIEKQEIECKLRSVKNVTLKAYPEK